MPKIGPYNTVRQKGSKPCHPPSYCEKPSSSRTPCTNIVTNCDIVSALRILHDSAGSFALLQDAVLSCLDLLKHPIGKPQEYVPLDTEIRALNTVLQRQKSLNCSQISDCAMNLALTIKHEASTLDAWRGYGSESTLVLDSNEGAFLEPITSLFRQLRIELTACNSSDWSKANKLERLSPVKSAYDNSAFPRRQPCARGTCIRALSELSDWEITAYRVYWMTGSSGTGKTTIATTFSHKLEEKKRLAASFFCSQFFLELRQVNRIIPTIAYQLAHYSMAFRGTLSKALEKDPAIGSMHLASQFNCLLKNPLIKAGEAIPRNLVVVLDALDECDDQVEAELLLSLLIQGSNTLPVRFFITTKAEQAISSVTLRSGQLEDLLGQEDVRRYLEGELNDTPLTIDQMKHLARRSGTLFIYAATLARSIRYFSRSVPLQRLLQSMAPESTGERPNIDDLYEAILRLVLGLVAGSEPMAARNLGLVLTLASCAQELVDIDTVSGLTGIEDRDTILSMLNSLRPLLTVSNDGLLLIIHSSFSHFMSDRTRLATLLFEPEEYRRISLASSSVLDGSNEPKTSDRHWTLCATKGSTVGQKCQRFS
ncbi:unnamed protein product [Rhizoctonia solani]|uniref:NACHT domain-containing protein n=1 Tax=Rhizoctonia solani TaxID=456999 RepID=A0A8H3CX71_9AGAM|nr:unnamed protein product [Rhizoctonia solani]